MSDMSAPLPRMRPISKLSTSAAGLLEHGHLGGQEIEGLKSCDGLSSLSPSWLTRP